MPRRRPAAALPHQAGEALDAARRAVAHHRGTGRTAPLTHALSALEAFPLSVPAREALTAALAAARTGPGPSPFYAVVQLALDLFEADAIAGRPHFTPASPQP